MRDRGERWSMRNTRRKGIILVMTWQCIPMVGAHQSKENGGASMRAQHVPTPGSILTLANSECDPT